MVTSLPRERRLRRCWPTDSQASSEWGSTNVITAVLQPDLGPARLLARVQRAQAGVAPHEPLRCRGDAQRGPRELHPARPRIALGPEAVALVAHDRPVSEVVADAALEVLLVVQRDQLVGLAGDGDAEQPAADVRKVVADP